MESVPAPKTGLFGKILLFVMVVIAMLIMFSIFYYLDGWREERFPTQENELEDVLTSGMLACVEMGCPAGTKFIGSSGGVSYHDCATTQARSIKSENRVCFSSYQEAVAKGYTT
jgi:hypothetical protein